MFFFSVRSSVKIISVYVGWSVEQSAGTRLPPSRTLEIPSSKAGVAGTRDPSRPLSSSSRLVEAEVDRRRRTGWKTWTGHSLQDLLPGQVSEQNLVSHCLCPLSPGDNQYQWTTLTLRQLLLFKEWTNESIRTKNFNESNDVILRVNFWKLIKRDFFKKKNILVLRMRCWYMRQYYVPDCSLRHPSARMHEFH